MNLLDENIPANQRVLLERWRMRVYQIGFNLARKGLKDEEIIPYLLTQRRPTFFTRDEDFWDRNLCHRKYCLVYLAVDKNEAAAYVRSLLRHAEFDTLAKRLGCVVRLSHSGLSLWRIGEEQKISIDWDG
jgi:hypothetical protein